MERNSTFRKLLLLTLICAAFGVSAQIHPLTFGTNNWYRNYVGVRFEVTAPASIAGDKQYTTGNDGSGGTGAWGKALTTPIINQPVAMPQPGDSLATSPITSAVTGKIAIIYRGTNEFGEKALAAQNAGAIACVIVNNVGGGPVGMAAGSKGALVTLIPVYMISKADGDAIDSMYNMGITVTMTITPWGQGFKNDLGFVTQGIAQWHDYAVPANQLSAGGVSPYKGLDGGFVANYGANTVTNVKVTDTLTFTPKTGGIPTTIHTGVTPTLASFKGLSSPTPDSIYALFSATEYDVTTTGPGQFNLKYTVHSDSDAFEPYLGDNTVTTSYYATDSLYSKGRYDFTNNVPVSTLYEAFNSNGEFVWGPMYYVAKGGSAISRIQYSLASNTPGAFTAATSNNLYLFQWVDGTGGPADSIVQDGELNLVGLYVKNYGVNDTSNAQLTAQMGDPSDGVVRSPIFLSANSWYYLAVDVPATLFLGCDGVLDPYPRIFGRFHATNSILDYSNIVAGTSQSGIASTPTSANFPVPNVSTTYVNAVDSFVYSNMKGLIPSVAMIVNNSPDTTTVIDHTGVNVVSKPFANVTLSPNPAQDYLNVAIELDQTAPTVTYTIIDGLARIVGKETHTNIKSEINTISTANMAAGHYYLIINANNQVMSRKFVIIK